MSFNRGAGTIYLMETDEDLLITLLIPNFLKGSL